MDYSIILNNSFKWKKNKEAMKYLKIWFLINLISFLVYFFTISDTINKIYVQIIMKIYGMSYGILLMGSRPLIEILKFIAEVLPQLIITTLNQFPESITIISITFVGYFMILLIQGFFSVLILLKGMNFYKIKTAPFNATKYVKLIILQILSGILALISYYDKRFFFVFIGIIALYLIGIITLISGIGIILLLLALFLSFFYLFIVIYNSIRLSMTPYVFLETNKGIFQSLRDGWNLTQGKVIDIFIALLIIGVIFFVVSRSIGYIGINYFVSSLIYMLFSAIWMGFGAYYYAGIYSQVRKRK